MKNVKRITCAGLAIALLAGSADTAAGSEIETFVEEWIARMDARPPEQQVPNWPQIRKLMMREAPKVGEAAPEFALKTRDGDETIRLSEMHESKPVVLIFGSWT